MSSLFLFLAPHDSSENSEQIFLYFYTEEGREKKKRICSWKFLSSKIF